MESEYLQREVGSVLARALAETVVAMPADPVEFLAQWLIAHTHREDSLSALQKQADAISRERHRVEQEHQEALERAERERRNAEAAAQAAEEARIAAIQAHIAPLDTALVEAETKTAALGEQERKAAPMAQWSNRLEVFKATTKEQSVMDEIAALPRGRAPPVPVVQLASLALYLLDLVDEPLEAWKVLKPVLREENLLDHVASFDPLSLQRTSKFRRVERRLLYLESNGIDELKKASFGAYYFYQWMKLCTEMRKAASGFKNAKLGLTDETPPVVALAPGAHSEDDEQDEEAEEEEDLGQVIGKILRSEQEELELEAARKKAAEGTSSAAEDEQDEDDDEEQK